MESCFGRALLNSPFKELPWKIIIPRILQIRLPTKTQQTPNKAPKRLQQGLNLDTSFENLNWVPHLESSFGELFWRALLESSFGELFWRAALRALLEGPWIYLILPVKTQNSTQFSGFFLSKHTWKWIYLILPVKTQNSTQFSRFFLSKSKFDKKKFDK